MNHNSVTPDHDIDYTNSYDADLDGYFNEMLGTESGEGEGEGETTTSFISTKL